MARIRTIKPEWTDDEALAGISIQANFVMVMVLLFSDDFGVVKANPVWLRNKIFPMRIDVSQREFNGWIDELQKIGMLRAFHDERTNAEYFYISGFTKHQRVDKPNAKMRNPEPPADVMERKAATPKAVDETKAAAEKEFPDSVKELTELFISGLRANDPGARIPANKSGWYDAIHKILTKDGRTPEQLQTVIRFATTDKFWKANILSAGKLREKFSQLLLKSNGNTNTNNGAPAQRAVPTIGGLKNEFNWNGSSDNRPTSGAPANPVAG